MSDWIHDEGCVSCCHTSRGGQEISFEMFFDAKINLFFNKKFLLNKILRVDFLKLKKDSILLISCASMDCKEKFFIHRFTCENVRQSQLLSSCRVSMYINCRMELVDGDMKSTN